MERREDKKVYREEMIKGLMRERERERGRCIYTEREGEGLRFLVGLGGEGSFLFVSFEFVKLQLSTCLVYYN
jgi:hypothetical protein